MRFSVKPRYFLLPKPFHHIKRLVLRHMHMNKINKTGGDTEGLCELCALVWWLFFVCFVHFVVNYYVSELSGTRNKYMSP